MTNYQQAIAQLLAAHPIKYALDNDIEILGDERLRALSTRRRWPRG